MTARVKRLLKLTFPVTEPTESFLFCPTCPDIEFRGGRYKGNKKCPSCLATMETCRGMELDNVRAAVPEFTRPEAWPSGLSPEFAAWHCGGCQKELTGYWEHAGAPCTDCAVHWYCPKCGAPQIDYSAFQGNHCDQCVETTMEEADREFDRAVASGENAAEAATRSTLNFRERENRA